MLDAVKSDVTSASDLPKSSSPIEVQRMTEYKWQANTLRITLFGIPTPEFNLTRTTLWKITTDESSDGRIEQPKTNTFQENGVINNVSLVIKTEGERIDLFLHPFVGNEITVDEDLSLTVETFSIYAYKFLSGISNFSVSRIAFGGTLFYKPTDINTLRTMLSKITGAQFKEGALDFMYRINQPYEINIFNNAFTINQISTWSSVVFLKQLFSMSNPTMSMPPMEDVYAQLEIDINNKPNTSQVLDQKLLIGLFDSLKERFLSISENGAMTNRDG